MHVQLWIGNLWIGLCITVCKFCCKLATSGSLHEWDATAVKQTHPRKYILREVVLTQKPRCKINAPWCKLMLNFKSATATRKNHLDKGVDVLWLISKVCCPVYWIRKHCIWKDKTRWIHQQPKQARHLFCAFIQAGPHEMWGNPHRYWNLWVFKPVDSGSPPSCEPDQNCTLAGSRLSSETCKGHVQLPVASEGLRMPYQSIKMSLPVFPENQQQLFLPIMGTPRPTEAAGSHA